MYEFDIIVIGSGSAGISAVEAAIDAGAEKVAVVEGVSRLGGECPNWACVPTKALLRSVEVLSVVRRVEDFGIKVSRPSFQFGKIMARKTRIVDALTKPPRLEGILKKLNVTVIKGWATFLNPLEIEVRGKRYRAQKFIIATGSEHVLPPVEGLKEISYLTSDDLMGIPRVPSSLLIVGGGPVGAECAQIFAPLGTKVTIVEFSPHLLSREEPEVAEVVERSLTRQGVAIFSSKKVLSVRMRRKQIAVTVASVNDETKQQEIIASHILVAAGKRPRVNRLGLEAIGVNMDKRGAPIVNEYLQTNIPSVYVAGDAAGHMLFTHVAHYEGEVAGKNAVVGNKQKIDLSVVPRGTFTTPEVGSVGITEAEAKKKGLEVGVGTVPYAVLGKAIVTGEREGLVKIVVDKNSKMILGGHIVGVSASEIVHEIALAMYANIPYTTVANMIHAYPTFAEAVGAAAYSVK